MEQALLAALPVGGWGAVAALAVAVAAKAGVALWHEDRNNSPPVVPGFPLIGNLHQLREKRPHKTFLKWSGIYGPIYTIRTGASSVVVLNSTEVAKEAMVAMFSSISTRKLSKAFSAITRDKTMVATSDYGDFHKMVKRYVIAGALGSSAQRKFRNTRDMMIDNMLSTYGKLVIDDPHAPLNFREVFKNELFRLSLIQSLGKGIVSGLPGGREHITDRGAIDNAGVGGTHRGWQAADTTLVATEWAMYELAKNPEKQDRLFREIQEVCGDKTVTEDHLPQLAYLNGVFHETLRLHSPAPLIPPRFVHESTKLAGYNIPAGTQIIINLYGCNMNKNDWEEPEEWRPERFLDGRFEAADMYKTGVRRWEEGLPGCGAGGEHFVHRHCAVRAGVRVEAQGGRRGQRRHRPAHELQAPTAICVSHTKKKDVNYELWWEQAVLQNLAKRDGTWQAKLRVRQHA
ncbi:hypothetical protein ACQ4PT_012822 [Festuca glaucescens]